MKSALVSEHGVTEAMISDLVHAFYARVRADPDLGPIFEGAIRGVWEPHLQKMCAFWSSVMLTSGRYKGNPMAAHLRHKSIRPFHFDRWLALFRETAQQVCPPDAASAFIDRAERIADSLQRGMFFNPRFATYAGGGNAAAATPTRRAGPGPS